jgi:hypothetical protein
MRGLTDKETIANFMRLMGRDARQSARFTSPVDVPQSVLAGETLR